MSFSPKVGEKAPYFNLTSAFGPVRLSDYDGKWLVLCFHKYGPSPIYANDLTNFSTRLKEFESLNTKLLCVTNQVEVINDLAKGCLHRLTPFKEQIPVVLDQFNELANVYGVNNDYTRGNPNSDRSIFIIDPNQNIQTILHYPILSRAAVNNTLNMLRFLTADSRVEIHQNIAPSYVSPNCPTLSPIVGEYVLGNPNDVDPRLLDFVIYAFALIKPDGTLQPYSTQYLKNLVSLKKDKPSLQVIMAIGGWAADGFSDAALTPKSRYAFAREIQKWVNEYNLDGIDLDWEYPGNSASGIKSRKEDKENFTLLIEAIRDVLGPDKWISVAGSGDAAYIRNVEIDKIGALINYFNVMAYDFTAGETGVNGAKHQSNLYDSPLALSKAYSVDTFINNLITAGMPSQKILLGVPYYGRLGASLTKTYDELRRNYFNKNSYSVKWDEQAKAPYLADQDGNFAMSFDSALSIYYKGLYVYENCLGGLFAWHSGMDKANILSRALSTAISSPDQLESDIANNIY